jgi:hypothetical protein
MESSLRKQMEELAASKMRVTVDPDGVEYGDGTAARAGQFSSGLQPQDLRTVGSLRGLDPALQRGVYEGRTTERKDVFPDEHGEDVDEDAVAAYLKRVASDMVDSDSSDSASTSSA